MTLTSMLHVRRRSAQVDGFKHLHEKIKLWHHMLHGRLFGEDVRRSVLTHSSLMLRQLRYVRSVCGEQECKLD